MTAVSAQGAFDTPTMQCGYEEPRIPGNEGLWEQRTYSGICITPTEHLALQEINGEYLLNKLELSTEIT